MKVLVACEFSGIAKGGENVSKRYSFTADENIKEYIETLQKIYEVNAAASIKMLINEGYWILQEYNRVPMPGEWSRGEGVPGKGSR